MLTFAYFSFLTILQFSDGFFVTVGILFIIFNLMIINLQALFWFLLFHLTYYSISYRIGILKSFVIENNEPQILGERIKKFKTCGYIFDRICLAAREINMTFSWTVLLNLLLLMFLCSTSLFFAIYLTQSTLSIPLVTAIPSIPYSFIAIFLASLQMILVILLGADSPVNEVQILFFLTTADDLI